jgi:hypothetical protein
MAMKKTSGGDSPLRQGAGKSFWTTSPRPWCGSLVAPLCLLFGVLEAL